MQIVSKSLKETEDFARKVLGFLEQKKKIGGAEVLALYGDLGAGKTAFVKTLGKLLGIKESITSPTFPIMKSYKPQTLSFKRLVHIDAYRIENHREITDLGFSDLIKEEGTLIAIEWPEKIREVLPTALTEIYFEFVDETTRNINLKIQI